MQKIKDMSLFDRPRERLKEYGAGNLSTYELLAIIIGEGNKELSALDLAKLLLERFPLEELVNISINELKEIKGIKDAKAIRILSAIEFGKRVLRKDSIRYSLTNPKAIYEYIRYDLENLEQENFVSIYLDSKCQVIAKKLLFIGTISKTIVHPREIFKYAYKYSAYAIIICHNHPSGNSFPSNADIDITNRIQQIAREMEICFLDHLVIGKNEYYSFSEKGKISND